MLSLRTRATTKSICARLFKGGIKSFALSNTQQVRVCNRSNSSRDLKMEPEAELSREAALYSLAYTGSYSASCLASKQS